MRRQRLRRRLGSPRGRRLRARHCLLTCRPVRARGGGRGARGPGRGAVRRAPRLPVSRSVCPRLSASRPLSPQPRPPSAGTKRLRGGAEPAALAGASGDGRAPSSDSSGQPPIRPQETESPCVASSSPLPPDPTPFPSPHPLCSPGCPPALSTAPPTHTPRFPLGVPRKRRSPSGPLAQMPVLRSPNPSGEGSPGSPP